MLRGIEFKAERFDMKNDHYRFIDLTKNTIILCNNWKLMQSLAEEIIKTVNGEAEYNDYDCDDEDIGKARLILNFGLQKVIDINGQKITLCLEPAMIYQARSVKDIWFFDWTGNEELGIPYKEAIYALTDFKGHKEKWREGKDEVYKYIVNGRYGTYDGKWVKLDAK